MPNFSDTFIGNKIRLCASCCQEQRIDVPMKKHIESLGWMISDGLCVRHFKKTFKTAGFDDDRIQKMVDDKLKNTDNKPPRDLSESENQLLVEWLKNPTPFKEKS